MSPTAIELKISHLLQDEEKRSILAYKERAAQLLGTRIMKESGAIHLRLSYELGKPLIARVQLPPEEELRSFYMAFRFFYLQKEPSNFLRVANILDFRASSDMVSQYVKALKDQWNGALARKGWSLSVNGEELTTSLLINLWFNAHYFHSDDDKGRRLQELSGILSTEFNRYLLADAVFDASKAVTRLYDSIKTIKL